MSGDPYEYNVMTHHIIFIHRHYYIRSLYFCCSQNMCCCGICPGFCPLVGSGNARPVVCYPDQYLPSPTSTSAMRLAALHDRWVRCALYRVSQWGIFFAHMRMSESASCVHVNLNQADDVHRKLLLANQHSWWRLWAVTKASAYCGRCRQSVTKASGYQCGRSWQWPPLRKCWAEHCIPDVSCFTSRLRWL